MRLFVVSADESGLGKTTLASSLVGEHNVLSLAGYVRKELQDKYPGYEWYNKSQNYKDRTVVLEHPKYFTVRECLVEHGEARHLTDSLKWVRKAVDYLQNLERMPNTSSVAIDDLRFPEELSALREAFPDLVHFHIVEEGNVQASPFDDVADYLVHHD